MDTSQIPKDVIEICDIMDFVGGIDYGEKLFFKHMLYVKKTDYFNRFRKFMEGETIEDQMTYMNYIFREYIIMKKDYGYRYNCYLDISFIRMCNGVKRLTRTYKNPRLVRFHEMLVRYKKMLL